MHSCCLLVKFIALDVYCMCVYCIAAAPAAHRQAGRELGVAAAGPR